MPNDQTTKGNLTPTESGEDEQSIENLAATDPGDEPADDPEQVAIDINVDWASNDNLAATDPTNPAQDENSDSASEVVFDTTLVSQDAQTDKTYEISQVLKAAFASALISYLTLDRLKHENLALLSADEKIDCLYSKVMFYFHKLQPNTEFNADADTDDDSIYGQSEASAFNLLALLDNKRHCAMLYPKCLEVYNNDRNLLVADSLFLQNVEDEKKDLEIELYLSSNRKNTLESYLKVFFKAVVIQALDEDGNADDDLLNDPLKYVSKPLIKQFFEQLAIQNSPSFHISRSLGLYFSSKKPAAESDAPANSNALQLSM